MSHPAIHSVVVRRLAIPLRWCVEHAASRRNDAEPVVIAVELHGGVTGYGETLPRIYVTGETVDSVVKAIESVYLPQLLELRPTCFADALEAIEALGWCDAAGEPSPSARAAVELALLDAYSRHFKRPIAEAAGWMGCNEFGPPGSIPSIRHSGVLATNDTGRMMRFLRMLWWYGIRDFKLKVGDAGDEDRLDRALSFLRREIERGKATLRVDSNGAWSLREAVKRLTHWRDRPIAFVEQPLARGREEELAELKSCVHQPLMYDESLVTMDDAKRLVEQQAADGFNIRISKCGGLLPSLRLAKFANKHGVAVQLGCMVGETGILSAAGRKFLELVPGVRYAEGSFGKLLLAEDLVARPLRFGYAGKVNPLPGIGWGIDVDAARLESLTRERTPYMF